MERLAETKAVKAALIKAGYTRVKVGHGTGTAWGWLHVRCKNKPDQDWQDKRIEVERIAQQVTGRQGDYGGRIIIQ